MRTFQYCTECGDEWPLKALEDGVCPVCWKAPEPDPVGAGLCPRPRTHEPVALPEPERRFPSLPLPRHLRELDEKCARQRLLSMREEKKEKKKKQDGQPTDWVCAKCGQGDREYHARDLCHSCYACWLKAGKPLNGNGAPDLDAFEAAIVGQGLRREP